MVDLPVLVRSTHSNVSLHRDRLDTRHKSVNNIEVLLISHQGHVDAGTEGDGWHGVQHVDQEFRQESRAGEPVDHSLQGGVGVYRYICHDIPEPRKLSIIYFLSNYIKSKKRRKKVQINENRREIRLGSLTIKVERVEEIKVNY